MLSFIPYNAKEAILTQWCKTKLWTLHHHPSLQSKVWLLDGTDARGALAMHVCDVEACPQPPRARYQPSDRRKLMCEVHHQQRECREQEERQQWQLVGCEDQAEQDSGSSNSSSSSKVYIGGARMGGVNGVFAPCGHVLGLSPQYGEL
eukprot:1151027-Pelagomonas_calceolata.AAC.1